MKDVDDIHGEEFEMKGLREILWVSLTARKLSVWVLGVERMSLASVMIMYCHVM